jgi:hypothetical protein
MELRMERFPLESIKIFFNLSRIFLALGVFGFANVAYADVNGIPYNPEFPKAQYPYAQAPDGCSGWTSTKQVRDNWGSVSFTGACNTHDKCYYTLGSNWNTCNERFYSDLRAACERDLRISTPLGKLPPDPVRLTACYQIATSYYGVVQGAVALGVFKEAQDKQRKYEEWVASTRKLSAGVYRLADGSIFSTNGRDAYCTYQNMDHFSFAADKSLRPATSFPSLRNDGPCPVILPAGNYRQPDGLIFYSNGKDAFCAYRRVPGGFIRQLNGPVPYERLMRNDGVCAGQ